MWREERVTQTVAAGTRNKQINFIKLCHLVTLSVSKVIWYWWQISKWLWCIGRLILATDNWSTETNLSHCHWTTINNRQTPGNEPSSLDYEGFAYLSLLFCVLINFWLYGRTTNPAWEHRLGPKINTSFGLPLAQLFSVHLLRRRMGHNAVHYHSHTALRNCWLRFLGTT
jgi:hypothetical protein